MVPFTIVNFTILISLETNSRIRFIQDFDVSGLSTTGVEWV